MIDEIDFAKQDGLVPAIAQDHQTGEVLMLAYMNAEALDETIRTGRACYYSRSKNRLWRKGEESGNIQIVHSLYTDCDHDTILLKVEQLGGAACHTGHRSCFHLRHQDGALMVEGQPLFDPDEVYRK